ncbi:CatB-related O-acetyltransferase [Rhizobium nepotum]|uniref:CatB-related O-acetyltransferase n=1 Tax=Rhizobium nepotum TaxID=1035271 RepID=UPI0005D376E6|nr:CatB-related O-acetyltransferase [Rhizobium nepotum]
MDIAATLQARKISFMGGVASTKFGLGWRRDPIILETFIQFRGGQIDAREIGAFTYLGCPASQVLHIGSIGRFCSIGPRLIAGPSEHSTSMLSSHSLLTGNWDQQWPELSTEFGITKDQVTAANNKLKTDIQKRAGRINIGSDVWIGDGVFISRGVTIGDGAVIAARSVVSQDVPPYSIVAGTPAKIIRMRFDTLVVARLMQLKWWEYGPAILADIDWTSPSACLDALEARVLDGANKYAPDRIRLITNTEYEEIPASLT